VDIAQIPTGAPQPWVESTTALKHKTTHWIMKDFVHQQGRARDQCPFHGVAQFAFGGWARRTGWAAGGMVDCVDSGVGCVVGHGQQRILVVEGHGFGAAGKINDCRWWWLRSLEKRVVFVRYRVRVRFPKPENTIPGHKTPHHNQQGKCQQGGKARLITGNRERMQFSVVFLKYD
jgi:hypothetical protein